MAERRGFLLPIRRNARGFLAYGGGDEFTLTRVRNVMSAVGESPLTRGELPWRNDFGVGVSGLRHRANRRSTAEIAAVEIERGFTRYLTDLELTEVRATRDDATGPGQNNVLNLYVQFRERVTGRRYPILGRLPLKA